MSFQGEVVSALRVSSGDGGLGLRHKLFDLADHLLLAGVKLLACNLLQIEFGGGRELLGRALVHSLLGTGAAGKLDRRLGRSTVAYNFLRSRTRFRSGGSGIRRNGIRGPCAGGVGARGAFGTGGIPDRRVQWGWSDRAIGGRGFLVMLARFARRLGRSCGVRLAVCGG